MRTGIQIGTVSQETGLGNHLATWSSHRQYWATNVARAIQGKLGHSEVEIPSQARAALSPHAAAVLGHVDSRAPLFAQDHGSFVDRERATAAAPFGSRATSR